MGAGWGKCDEGSAFRYREHPDSSAGGPAEEAVEVGLAVEELRSAHPVAPAAEQLGIGVDPRVAPAQLLPARARVPVVVDDRERADVGVGGEKVEERRVPGVPQL